MNLFFQIFSILFYLFVFLKYFLDSNFLLFCKSIFEIDLYNYTINNVIIKHTKGKCKDTGEGRLIKVQFIYNDTFNGFHFIFFPLLYLINSKQLLKLLQTRNNEVKFKIFNSQFLRCFFINFILQHSL